METTIQAIACNLHVINDRIVLIGFKGADFIGVCTSIDDAIKANIGQLMVQQCDMDVRTKGSGKSDWKYTVPLTKYLHVIEELPDFQHYKKIPWITNSGKQLFNIGHLAEASTCEDHNDLRTWEQLKKQLGNLVAFFESTEEQGRYIVLNRDATAQKMRKRFAELDNKMPKYLATLEVMSGLVTESPQKHDEQYLAAVSISQLKTPHSKKVEKTVATLVNRLNKFDGPCLSNDAERLIYQATRLMNYCTSLIENYGDILANPRWQERLFTISP